MKIVPFAISHHATVRYRERVNPALSADEAREAIRGHAAAIGVAIGFGCPCIKLACGARLVLNDATVVTVLAPYHWPPLPPREWRP